MLRAIKLIVLGLTILILLSHCSQAIELTHEEQIIIFTDQSKSDRSIVLNLPNDAVVSYFSFDLVGPLDESTTQPWNMTLDIGDNGTIDWSLKREYGPLGCQSIFNNGDEELTLGFIPGNYNQSGGIYLPTTAEVSTARMELAYTESDYLSPALIELNRPEWHPEAPYDYDPNMCIYQDRLFLAYRSYGWHDTNQSDADIALNSTGDGVHWQDKTTELSKAPDTEVPYQGGKRSGDFYPSMAVFKNKLYCAWESTSIEPIGSTHGTDRDIVWSYFDGDAWEPPRELTAPSEHAAEDEYSANPGVKDDYRVQLCTFGNGTNEQLFAIWTANNTGDETFPGDRIGDIIISHTTDGDYWSTGFDLTAGDKRYDIDYLPQLVEFRTIFGNALFAFWVTNNEKITNGSDWDIIYRYTTDGITWSEHYNLLEKCNVKESSNDLQAIDDDPAVIVYNGQLYVIWRSSNPSISNGEDIDIIMTHTSDGANWSKPLELTSSTDSMFNNRPRAAVYTDKLFIVWRAVKPDDDGAIILRGFDNDTGELSKPVTVSPVGTGGDDYSPDLIAFNDKLMVAWVTQDNTTALGNDSDVMFRWLIPRNGTPELALDPGSKGNYNDHWVMTKTKLSAGIKRTVDFKDKLLELLRDNNWKNANTINDEFGNDFYFIPLNTYFSTPGEVTLRSLEIRYNYTLTVSDLSVALSNYLKESGKSDAKNDNDQSNNIEIKLRFDSISNGKVKIQNLNVKYTISSKPQQYPELVCVMIIGIVLIIIGLLIKFARFGPRKAKSEPKKPT